MRRADTSARAQRAECRTTTQESAVNSPVTSVHANDLALDQAVALRAAAVRLEDEFDGVVADDAIEQFLHSAYEHVADHATIDNFLPLLAERYTREWLYALVDQHSDRA
ncbi:hypothetical protein FG87_24430 [Nocardia vulneris]|uniref:Protein-tyrosine-phosphatase-like N-terminal domain-containing protein n=1 Tax=Nocardia vulneris TaxID=1141657 RepID=A0ABR4ZB77_9NOCA|nr:hypothetical protein FG87_24430 [Nocardia vulneris]